MGAFKKSSPTLEKMFNLAEYKGLNKLYRRKNELVQQKNTLTARNEQVTNELKNLSNEEHDKEISAIIDGKININDLKSSLLQQQRALDEEKYDIELKLNMLDKTMDTLDLQIKGLEKEASAHFNKQGFEMLKPTMQKIIDALENLHEGHEEMFKIHRKLTINGGNTCPLKCYYGFEAPKLRSHKVKIDQYKESIKSAFNLEG